MLKQSRSEREVFHDLEQLCLSSGYLHAIAHFCFRDNVVMYADVLTPNEFFKKHSRETLIRTEISTLIGLALKGDLDFSLPTASVLEGYLEKTQNLLEELHYSIIPPINSFLGDQSPRDISEYFKMGSLLRESIFYSGESAYVFQYRDFIRDKYRKDNDWFIEKKGYSVDDAFNIFVAIQNLQNYKINDVFQSFYQKIPDQWIFTDAFKFTLKDLEGFCSVSPAKIEKFIESFVFTGYNESFLSLGDFNSINAYPIIKLHDGYLLFQCYSMAEALYETPFFWFNSDDSYKSLAMKNRGDFTEEFSAKKMERVFGKDRVFKNVDIFDKKNNNAGEIDVLVVFSNRVIVLQAKSKKLTIPARKGNDLALRDDFKKAIQNGYDQALSCAKLILDPDFKVIDESGHEVKFESGIKEIYPICIVSENYPALSFQAMQFLRQETSDKIQPAFVMDVFFLDVLTEMLDSPLKLLSYINRRTYYGDRVSSTHELTILSYHLERNLWLEENMDMVYLSDDICIGLDLEMSSRRDGMPVDRKEEWIFERYTGTHFRKIIDSIERRENANIVDFGFLLLTLSGDAIEKINDGISNLILLFEKDGRNHDLSMCMEDGKVGLTIHCNNNLFFDATNRLEKHCELRKYERKASQWFGVCFDPIAGRIKFGLSKDFEWAYSEALDAVTKNLPCKLQVLKYGRKINFKTVVRKNEKVGRNENCPCGSGKKYKKCCL